MSSEKSTEAKQGWNNTYIEQMEHFPFNVISRYPEEVLKGKANTGDVVNVWNGKNVVLGVYIGRKEDGENPSVAYPYLGDHPSPDLSVGKETLWIFESVFDICEREHLDGRGISYLSKYKNSGVPDEYWLYWERPQSQAVRLRSIALYNADVLLDYFSNNLEKNSDSSSRDVVIERLEKVLEKLNEFRADATDCHNTLLMRQDDEPTNSQWFSLVDRLVNHYASIK